MGCTQATTDKQKRQLKFLNAEQFSKKTSKPIAIVLNKSISFVFKQSKWENLSLTETAKDSTKDNNRQRQQTTQDLIKEQNKTKTDIKDINIKADKQLFQKLKLKEASLQKQIRMVTQKNEDLINQTNKNEQAIAKQKAYNKCLQYMVLVQSTNIDQYLQKIRVVQ